MMTRPPAETSERSPREEIAKLSSAKRELLQKYLQGDFPRSPTSNGTIHQRAVGSVVPLSYEQQHIWLHSQLAPELPLYNEILTVRRTGPLDVPALERSLSEIIRRHEAWRTVFHTVDGEPVQVILPPPTISLPVIDIRELPEAEREPEALRLAAEEARRPFDLVVGPLLRTKLVRLAEEEHRLYVTLHQIIFDGVSANSVFLPELVTLYEAYAVGRPSPLPEPEIQYADFAQWQCQEPRGETLCTQMQFWRRQLAGAPTDLELPTDRPRPKVQTFRGRQASFALPKSLSETLKEFSQQEGVTLFMTLLAAFEVLLYRYTGQEDILVGTAISTRKRPEVERLLGIFLNTLVLRTRLAEGLSFRQLLTRVREVTLEGLSHGDVPFHLLIKALQPNRDPGRNPLFQVTFELEPPLPAPGPGWGLTQMDVDTGVARVDLYFQLDDQPQGILGHIRYSSDLWDASTIDRLVTHFRLLLEGIIANPDRPISGLPMLTASERLGVPGHRAIARPSNSFVTFEEKDIEQSIPQAFERQVAKYPQRIAVRTGDAVWTYEALNQAANRVAHALSASQEIDGARVALLLDHDAPMLAGILGVLKAGGTYVPLDPTHPSDRLFHIVADSMTTAVLTSRKNVPLASELARQSVEICELDAIVSGATAPEYRSVASPDHLAYILYTSGSTGRPKGIVQNHRNVLHFIGAYTNNLHLCPEDRLTLMSSYSVDAAVMDIFGALLNGATLCPIDVRDVGLRGVGGRLEEHGVTVYHSTPTLYRHLVTALERSPKLATVRLVVLGGEEVRGEDVESYRELFAPDCIFVNGFGPTESTVSLQYFIDKPTEVERRSVPIGYPVERTAVSLLSSDGCPEQVYGEIAIRSPYVALGYWQRPDLTGMAFPPDPEGGKDRTYRTGDMGRLLPDGSVEFCGRKDLQVKIRGFRVELGEIEAALSQHPAVKEAAAAVCEATDGEKRVVAYWVANEQPAPSTDVICGFLRERLPNYMIPSAFVRVDALPLTPSGKLDRRALPAPDQAYQENVFTAPRDDLELQLAGIWQNLLGVERVGIGDDFFDLGGHSLLAIRMFAEVENRFGVRVPLATLMKAPTVERLADVLRNDGYPQPGHSLVAIQPAGSRPPLFCVHGHFGEILFYRDLARRLGPDQPFFALQAQGLAGKPAHQSIQAMAGDYVQEIRSVQPQSPYFIGGYCFGAIVAFEMAHQLLAQGQDVALLAVFWGYTLKPQLSERVKFNLEQLRRLGGRGKLAYLLGMSYRNHAATKARSWLWRLAYRLFGRRKRLSSRLLRNIPEMNLQAARTYVPQTYEGRMTVFLSGEMGQRVRFDPTRGLAGMTAREVEVVGVPGDRDSMLKEPFVRVLADRLEACMSRARAGK
jgi:amino acid adenylation domain-containing protein